MYKYSATQWIFGKEDIEVSLKRLKRFGYDGIELAGEPVSMDVEVIKGKLEDYEMECTSICGIYTSERDLSSSNQAIRNNAIQYVKDCVDMADQLGASVVIVVPTPVGKNSPDTTSQEEWGNVVKSLKEVGVYAEKKRIVLGIEALNRFETYLVNKMSMAIKVVEEVGLNSVKIMADLFHMNIEERSIVEALKTIAPYLSHVHIADNTREAAGLGMINFNDIVRTLIEIKYEGALTMEFLPPVSNPYLVAQQTEENSLYDDYTEQSINHMKKMVNSVTG